MSAHSPVPTEAQIRPLVEKHTAQWHWFTRMVTINIVAVVGLLVLLWAFLIKH